MPLRSSFTVALLLSVAVDAGAQVYGDGPKLVGTIPAVASTFAQQGSSAALSADGSTALVGGPGYSSDGGAAWVFTRSSGRWSQQTFFSPLVASASFGLAVALSGDGNTALVGAPFQDGGKGAVYVGIRSNGVWTFPVAFVPSDASSTARVGNSVAISSDGNTAVVGGPFDVQSGVSVGAAWVFTRSGNVWTQAAKLVGSVKGVGVPGEQGGSVALSGDGATAFVGGPSALSEAGSVWVFVLSGGSWIFQQRLFATTAGESGAGHFGSSVAASADGNTAIIGGPEDASQAGAAWVLVRTSGSLPWSVQGSKLTGPGESGAAAFGSSVAMSSDGNTAIVGGRLDSSELGAAWVFRRSNGTWNALQPKLVPLGSVGAPDSGSSVALSADASTALVGGPADNSPSMGLSNGATWVFTRSCIGPAGDANGNGTVDVGDVFALINFLFAGATAPVCR